MALDIATKYPGKSAPATPAYPFGSARNITTPGDGTGTPLEESWLNDLFGFQQALINGSGLTPSGVPDTAEASQYLQAARVLLGSTAKSLAELSAITATAEGQRAFLTDLGRGGAFNATLADISTEVTADTLQGVYVAFDSDPTGSSGGWVRDHGGRISPDAYGALGDWDGATGTDDSAAFLAAFTSGLSVFLRSTARYLLESAPAVSNQSLRIEGNGAEIIQKGDFVPIDVKLDFTDIQAVSALGTESIDLSGGSAAATTVAVATVSDASGYSVGDYCKIYSDDTIPATDPANQEQLGEFAKVSFVDGAQNKIYFYSVLRESYSTNIRVAKMSSEYKVVIEDVNFDIDGSANPAWNSPFVEVSGAFEADLKDLYCKRSRADVYRFISCFGTSTANLTAGDMRTDLSNNAFGYVVVEYSCEGGTHDQLKGYNSRHVYTTGTLATDPADTRPERYGSTRDFIVSNGYGFACQTAAFDTHPDARNGLFVGCISVSPYNGPIGTQLNYQLRGIGTEIKDCQSVGGRGYRINGTYDSLGSARDNKIIDCRHKFIKTFNQTREAVEIVGASATNKITGAVVSNLLVDKLAGSWTQIIVENAEVEVITPQIKDVSTGSGLGTILSADGDSDVRVYGLLADYRSSTDPFIRMFEVLSSTSKIVLDGARVIGQVSHIVDFNNLDGEFRAKNMDFETLAPSNTSGVTNVGASSIAAIDYVVGDGTISTRAELSIDYAAGGDKNVDLEYRGAKQLFCEITAAVISTDITTISDGAFIGQQLSIRCGVGSANNFDIETATGNIQIGSDFTVEIGRSFNFVWDGTNWLAA